MRSIIFNITSFSESKKSFSGFDYILSPNKLITDQLKYLVKDKSTQIFTVGYQYLRKKWSKMGKVFKSGAGHRYFPELYIKQFLNKPVLN